MPKAHEVASELRKLADALDREPEANVQQAWVYFHCDTKEAFLATAKLLPRPLTKEYDDEGNRWDRFHLKRSADFKGPIYIDCSVPRTLACRVIRPAQEAVYECEPLLSQIEEESLA